jgi:hypothetical protein
MQGLSILKDRKALHTAPPKGGAGEHKMSLDPKWKGAVPKPVPVLKTEAEILAFLGITYVAPKDRETIKSLVLI